VFLNQGCQSINTKKARPSTNKADNSLKTYTCETCITKHKIDIKTRQKHGYYIIPIVRRIFLSRNCVAANLFLIEYIGTFLGPHWNLCNIPWTLHGHRLWSEEICNEYAAQKFLCQSQAFLTSKKAKCVEKSQNFKIGLQKSQIGNPVLKINIEFFIT